MHCHQHHLLRRIVADVVAAVVTAVAALLFGRIAVVARLMLNSNFVNRHYFTEIFVFGDNCYLDKNQQFIADHNISFLFVYFDMLWDDLLALKKMYSENVSAQDVKLFMMQALPEFYSYFALLLRYSFLACIVNNPIDNILKSDRFNLNVGDYMARTEPVYKEQRYKDARKLATLFSERQYGKFSFGDYSYLVFPRKPSRTQIFVLRGFVVQT